MIARSALWSFAIGMATGLVLNSLVAHNIRFAPWAFSIIGVPLGLILFAQSDGRPSVIGASTFLLGCLAVFRFSAPFHYLMGFLVSLVWLGPLNAAIIGASRIAVSAIRIFGGSRSRSLN